MRNIFARGGCQALESARWARGDYRDPSEDTDDTLTHSEHFALFCQNRYGQAVDRMDGYTFAEAKQAYYETYEEYHA